MVRYQRHPIRVSSNPPQNPLRHISEIQPQPDAHQRVMTPDLFAQPLLLPIQII
mgnify:CR=1 FL=1